MDSLKSVQYSIENCNSRIKSSQKEIKKDEMQILKYRFIVVFQAIGFCATGGLFVLGLLIAYDTYRGIMDQSSILNQSIRHFLGGWFWVYLIMISALSFGWDWTKEFYVKIKSTLKSLENHRNSIEWKESSIRKDEIDLAELHRKVESYKKFSNMGDLLD